VIAISRTSGVDTWRQRRFDVICAGEVLWSATVGDTPTSPVTPGAPLGLRPGGGALNAAVALSQRGLRVGLAAALGDDAHGRALVARVRAAGIDAGGVTLSSERANLVFVDAAGDAARVVPFRAEDEPPFAVPAGWAADVLLLSGLSPALAPAASRCKAARAARRAGSLVVVDVNARRRAWAGYDPRAIQAVLREADVVRCSTEDLAGLGIDEAKARAAMRPEATLVLTHGAGPARALGPFGEVVVSPREVRRQAAGGAGDVFTAALCAELARRGDPGSDRPSLWDRALRRGHEAALERLSAAR
jgi:2-dehydro-3-deoxygluconokinase